MTPNRYKALSLNPAAEELSPQEIKDGWWFCACEWDGLLINAFDKSGEGALCACAKRYHGRHPLQHSSGMAPNFMLPPPHKHQDHYSIGNEVQPDGIVSKCVCGWISRPAFSNMIATILGEEHREEKRKENRGS